MDLINTFNRGKVSKLASARHDVDRISKSGLVMDNFMPMRLGGMTFRSGLKDLGVVPTLTKVIVSFTRRLGSSMLLGFVPNGVTRWRNDSIVVRTPPSPVVIPQFNDPSWGTSSGVGSSTWFTRTISSFRVWGYEPTGASLITRLTSFPMVGMYYMRVNVRSGGIQLNIGSGVNFGDVVSRYLPVGNHSVPVNITAAGSVFITFSYPHQFIVSEVDSIFIEQAGSSTLPSTVISGAVSMGSLRYKQSNDVMFFTQRNGAPFKFLDYGDDGDAVSTISASTRPFAGINVSKTSLTVGTQIDTGAGKGSLTSTTPLFNLSHSGRQVRVTHQGQQSKIAVSGGGLTGGGHTEAVKVSGVGVSRNIFYQLRTRVGSTAVFNAHVVLQVSPDGLTWTDLMAIPALTGLPHTLFNDGLPSGVIYYRLNIPSAYYVSGDFIATISCSGGTHDSIDTITRFISPTLVETEVVAPHFPLVTADAALPTTTLESNNHSLDWRWGEWSDDLGWPTALEFHQGRLWYARGGRLWASVSDDYENFSLDSDHGDAGAIHRTITFGNSSDAMWIESGRQLIIGTDAGEIAVRSDSFGGVITPFNCNLTPSTNVGSSEVPPVKIDSSVFFAHRSGASLFRSEYAYSNDAAALTDMNTLTPDMFEGVPITSITATRHPESRVFVTTSDGNMAVLLDDRVEDVSGWSNIHMGFGDTFSQVFTVFDGEEDQVYAVVNGDRLVKFEMFSNRKTHFTDFHQEYQFGAGALNPTVTGLSYLNGRTVTIFGLEGNPGDPPHIISTGVVAGGAVTIPGTIYWVVIGVPYTARYESNKIGRYENSVVTTRRKRVTRVGMVAVDMMIGGVAIGSVADSSTVRKLPRVESGQPQVYGTYDDEYDDGDMPFDGTLDTDGRIALTSSLPVTVLALSYELSTKTSTTSKK